MLNNQVVVNSVVPVQYRHKACHLCAMANMVRCIAGFSLPVDDAVYAGIDQAESPQHEIVHTGKPFARHNNRYFG